jgi:hypothetical protein
MLRPPAAGQPFDEGNIPIAPACHPTPRPNGCNLPNNQPSIRSSYSYSYSKNPVDPHRRQMRVSRPITTTLHPRLDPPSRVNSIKSESTQATNPDHMVSYAKSLGLAGV